MRFFAILSDSLRVFASFTYREYTRASPNTLFPILADHRRVSLILLYFTRFYAIFSQFYPILCESSRVSHTASIPELPRTHYSRLSPIIAAIRSFYFILCPVT